MILELDAGNSSIKWRIRRLSPASTLQSGSATSSLQLQEAIAEHSNAVREIRLCSVRSKEYCKELVEWGQQHLGLSVSVARVKRNRGGLTVHYEDLSRLGVDRWLAMLAAFKLAKGACIVVDGGTALTIDVIDAAGQHLGGYIVPGLAVMRRSIEENTSIRLELDTELGREESASLGQSTLDAVCNGTFAALCSLISRVYAERVVETGQCEIYLAGGDATALSKELRQLQERQGQPLHNIYCAPELVLDGLEIALGP